MSRAVLSMNFLKWRALMLGLRERGAGRRESGAFLLGKRHTDALRVQAVAFYDDLDPHSLDRGYVEFSAAGFSALWSKCRTLQLDVLADIHTHPGTSTAQSDVDRTNPMIAEAGHLALIVPCFAVTPWWDRSGISMFEYAGTYRWRNLSGELRTRLRITWL